jgi:hypothetical protein
MTYVYRSPLEDGFKRAYLPRKVHNRVFPRRKYHPLMTRYEYYTKGPHLRMDRFASIYVKILMVLLSPILILTMGIPNTYREMMDLFFQKSRGGFSGDMVKDEELIKSVLTKDKSN